MQFAVELYDLNPEQQAEVESILNQNLEPLALENTLYQKFIDWQTKHGLRLINPKHTRCSMCNVPNMCKEWAMWHVRESWPKRK